MGVDHDELHLPQETGVALAEHGKVLAGHPGEQGLEPGSSVYSAVSRAIASSSYTLGFSAHMKGRLRYSSR